MAPPAVGRRNAANLPTSLEIADGEHAEAVRRVREACHERRIAAGIHCALGEWAKVHPEAGFELITVATDAPLLRGVASRELAVARGGRAGP